MMATAVAVASAATRWSRCSWRMDRNFAQSKAASRSRSTSLALIKRPLALSSSLTASALTTGAMAVSPKEMAFRRVGTGLVGLVASASTLVLPIESLALAKICLGLKTPRRLYKRRPEDPDCSLATPQVKVARRRVMADWLSTSTAQDKWYWRIEEAGFLDPISGVA